MPQRIGENEPDGPGPLLTGVTYNPDVRLEASHPPGQMRNVLSRRWLVWVGLLLALALTLRLARVMEVNDSPTGVALTGDSVAYDRGARLLLDHGLLQPRIFDQAPAYPLLVAATYAVTGRGGNGGSGENGPRGLRLVQVLADVAALLALTIATRRRLGEAAALAVAALGAFFGPMVFAAALVGKETFTGFALALFVLLAFGSRAATHHQPGRWLAAGLALGSAMLLRENLLLLGLALPWMVAPSDKPGERRWAILSCGLGVALVLGAFAAWGLRATGDVTISSHQAGRNLLIGNLRGGNGLYRPLGGGSQDPEQEIADAAALAARILERETSQSVTAGSLTSAQVSRTLAEEAVREIRADPWAWLRLSGRKVLLTLNSYEVPDTESLLLERATSPALQLARIGFVVLLPLAAAGWLSQLSQQDRASWFVQRVGVLSLAVLASIWPFFLLGRYRWPSAVFLLPLAGAGLVALVSAATPAAIRCRAAIAAAVLCGVAFLPLVPREERSRHEAVARFNRGGAAAALAAEPLDRALQTRSAASSEAAAAWLTLALTDLDAALLLEPAMDAASLARAAVRHRQGLLAWLAGDRATASFCFETAATEAAGLATSPLTQIREAAASLETTARQNLVRFGAATAPSPQSPEP